MEKIATEWCGELVTELTKKEKLPIRMLDTKIKEIRDKKILIQKLEMSGTGLFYLYKRVYFIYFVRVFPRCHGYPT